MKNFKLFSKLSLVALMALSLFTVSCDDDDAETIITPVDTPDNPVEVFVTDNISGSTTWSGDSVYVLKGRITVVSGGTLTIEAGAVVKGDAGAGASATALLVAQGGTLIANGSATQPIIMTTVADQIEPSDIDAGNFASPNLSTDFDAAWGGLLVLGDAPCNLKSDAATTNIEGIPTTDANGVYGGSNAASNANTVIQYVSVRHGGSNIGSGNEINGITLGGVGTGATVSFVEVVANQDDGIEVFGGTVNISNALVWNHGDDGLDTDQGWIGTFDNFIVIGGGDRSMELDGPEGTDANTTSNFTMKNGSIIPGGGNMLDVDDNTNVDFDNLFFYANLKRKIEDAPVDVTEFTSTFTNLEILGVMNDDDGTDLGATALTDVYGGSGNVAFIAQGGSRTAGRGADASVFTWTWGDATGALDVLK